MMRDCNERIALNTTTIDSEGPSKRKPFFSHSDDTPSSVAESPIFVLVKL